MTKLSHAERSKITRRTSGRAKKYELRVAKFFGTKRTPLSGSNSGHTHSDTLHPRLYIEVKSAQANKGTNAWVWQVVHELPPGACSAVGVSQLLFVHSDAIVSPSCGYSVVLPKGLFECWSDANRKSIGEDKLPLLALCTKGSSGFWLVGLPEAIIAAARERALVE